MDYISKISEMYHGNILLQPPYQGEDFKDIPEEIASILCASDGIYETVTDPKTGETMPIGWIIYPCEMIQSDTAFYKSEYRLDGIAFSDDGAGNPFILKPDGAVVCFNAIDNTEERMSDSLLDFYTLYGGP